MAETGVLQRARLRELVGVGIALSSELSLDDLLQRVVESAAVLTGARYLALRVIHDGRMSERVFTHGIDSGETTIGRFPRTSREQLLRPGHPARIAYGNLF